MPDTPEPRAGMPAADDARSTRELYDRFAERLLALARRRLSPRLASRVDPEDIVQSVFRTFFGRLKDGRLHVDDPEDVCKLLMRITVHKTLRQVSFHTAAKRNPSLETGHGEQAQQQLVALLAREPTPEAVVVFEDQLEHFLKELRPEERQIIELRMQGYTNEEIAARLGIYDRKIRRVMERLRGIAEREGIAP
jgi:RNA polymerase sigma-70 factor (ECF subfamily)